MSEQSAQERPGAKVTETESTAANEQAGAASADSMATASRWPSPISSGPLAALRQTLPLARNFSLTGVAFLAIGAITYLAAPGWSGTSAGSVGAPAPSASASPSGRSTLPGPMPGAPIKQATTPTSPPPAGPPQPSSPTPSALQPANPTLVNAWNSGPGGSALANVTDQSSDVLMANAMGQYADMLQSCNALSTEVGNAQKAALLPDIAMQAKYAVALSSFVLASVDCAAAIRQVPDGVEDTVTDVNQSLLKGALSELRGGVSDLYTGTERIRRH